MAECRAAAPEEGSPRQAGLGVDLFRPGKHEKGKLPLEEGSNLSPCSLPPSADPSRASPSSSEASAAASSALHPLSPSGDELPDHPSVSESAAPVPRSPPAAALQQKQASLRNRKRTFQESNDDVLDFDEFACPERLDTPPPSASPPSDLSSQETRSPRSAPPAAAAAAAAAAELWDKLQTPVLSVQKILSEDNCGEMRDVMLKQERLYHPTQEHALGWLGEELTLEVRANTVRWMLNVAEALILSRETLYTAVSHLDRFLNSRRQVELQQRAKIVRQSLPPRSAVRQAPIDDDLDGTDPDGSGLPPPPPASAPPSILPRHCRPSIRAPEMPLITRANICELAVACISLATKLVDVFPPKHEELMGWSEAVAQRMNSLEANLPHYPRLRFQSLTPEDLKYWEMTILLALGLNSRPPTPYAWLKLYIRLAVQWTTCLFGGYSPMDLEAEWDSPEALQDHAHFSDSAPDRCCCCRAEDLHPMTPPPSLRSSALEDQLEPPRTPHQPIRVQLPAAPRRQRPSRRILQGGLNGGRPAEQVRDGLKDRPPPVDRCGFSERRGMQKRWIIRQLLSPDTLSRGMQLMDLVLMDCNTFLFFKPSQLAAAALVAVLHEQATHPQRFRLPILHPADPELQLPQQPVQFWLELTQHSLCCCRRRRSSLSSSTSLPPSPADDSPEPPAKRHRGSSPAAQPSSPCASCKQSSESMAVRAQTFPFDSILNLNHALFHDHPSSLHMAVDVNGLEVESRRKDSEIDRYIQSQLERLSHHSSHASTTAAARSGDRNPTLIAQMFRFVTGGDVQAFGPVIELFQALAREAPYRGVRAHSETHASLAIHPRDIYSFQQNHAPI